MKVFHIINGLGIGGAEKFLLRLSDELSDSFGVEQMIISLQPEKVNGLNLENKNVRIVYLNVRTNLQFLLSARIIRRLVTEFNPDVVQTWLYKSDMLSFFLKFLKIEAPVIWNIRCSNAPLSPQTRMLVKLCALLSKFVPTTIIMCGSKAKAVHIKYGYVLKKMVVINNGYRFASVCKLRSADVPLSLDERQCLLPVLIGAAGRFDKAKGYDILLHAFEKVIAKGRNAKLIIVGSNCTYDNPWLSKHIEQLGLRDRVELHGEVGDMSEFFKRLDIFCLSSISEGFPNVLCEAMGFGIPVVTTDAGEAEAIVGNTGFIVPIANETLLSNALLKMVDLPKDQRQDLGNRGALKVRRKFDIAKIGEEYFETYQRAQKNRNA